METIIYVIGKEQESAEAFQRTKKEDLEFAKGIFRKAKIILD